MKMASRLIDQIGAREPWIKVQYKDSPGIVGTTKRRRPRLKNIELQLWMSEMNNDVRRDADQINKMRTYRRFKTIENYRCEDPDLRHSGAD